MPVEALAAHDLRVVAPGGAAVLAPPVVATTATGTVVVPPSPDRTAS